MRSLSLNPRTSNYSTDIIIVVDPDIAPYNAYTCRVENEPNFVVQNIDSNKVEILLEKLKKIFPK
jgi:hypothetical protein